MKKILIGLFVILGCSTSFAQYQRNWIQYNYFNTSDHLRSVVYNPVTDHLLMPSRNGGNRVLILDPATGDSLGMLNLDETIVTGGTYVINQIGVSDDGTIYLANLSAPQYSPGSTFKVYRWDNETAAPVLVYSDALGDLRFGDSFAVAGSGHEIYLYTSGMGNDKVAVLKDTGAESLEFVTYVTVPYAGGARHSISPVIAGGEFWCKGDDSSHPPAMLMTMDGLLKAECPDTLIARGASSVKYVDMGITKMVFAMSAPSGSKPLLRAVKYQEDDLGVITFGYGGTASDSMMLLGGTGLNPNGNSTTSLAYDYRRHSVIVLAGNNCLASLSANQVFRASTPRIDTLYPGSVIIDGSMDFFPSDRVAATQRHQCYLTWSNSKLFTGITGPTLLGTGNPNYFYLAFDTNPAEGAGLAVPPVTDGGITRLPFNADVVLEIEPWDEEGPMVGKIYKANGTGWTSTEFDGETAAQGALAWSKNAPLELTEIAAIRDDICLGRSSGTLGMVAYLVNRQADSLVCAFPVQNSPGAVSSLNYYFLIDSLGQNMYPADTQFVKVRQAAAVGICQPQTNPKTGCILAPNYPNPFNPSTTIQFSINHRAHVVLDLYDMLGHRVKTMIDQLLESGAHQFQLNADDLPSGIYFYRLEIDGRVSDIRKMALLK